jgi:predicted dehydrogenase
MNSSRLTRRQFVAKSAGATAAFSILTSPRPGRAAAPASKVTIGVMGLGGRGSYLAQAFASRPDTNLAYICDADTRKFARTRDAIEEAQGRAPKQVQDFRRILEDKSVDVLINATPDHWHAPASILACQAGKDVYVEKPMTHNAWEGRKMIEAAAKYKRVIQVGMQSRSAQYFQEASWATSMSSGSST